MSIASEKLKVESADGTSIDVWRSGTGPPLVLVHGTTADHSRWDDVLPAFGARFTVHAMDRRGRRQDAEKPYDFEREVEDVLAVMRAAGTSPHLLGHSFGAMCALEAAARAPDIGKLVLYEGGFTSSGRPEWAPIAARMATLAAEGRREEALEVLMREIAMLSEKDLETMRRAPSWQPRLDAVHTIPRELRVAMSYRLREEMAALVRVPTLLLVGGASPASEQEDAARAAKVLPDARMVVLPGQGHAAMDTAPASFVDEVLRFLA